MDVVEDKSLLRTAMQKTRASLSPTYRDEAARAAATHINNLITKKATVALYSAMFGELSTEPAALAFLGRRFTLVYPKVLPNKELSFHRVSNLADLKPGYSGIPEPPASLPEVPLVDIDFFVVPGLAFDYRGSRLGWGAGCYDRALVDTKSTIVGYAYTQQIVGRVPSDDRDVPVDYVVGDFGLLKCCYSPGGCRSRLPIM